jgi:hypothetical protein
LLGRTRASWLTRTKIRLSIVRRRVSKGLVWEEQFR